MDDKFNFLKSKIISSRVYPEYFKLNKNDIVLNVGAGEGPQVIAYKDSFKKMVCVDINQQRLEFLKQAMEKWQITNYETLCGNVENIPITNQDFNKILAIDIVEHVENPKKLCLEINRLLKSNGHMLITFPLTHDAFVNFVNSTGRFILRRKKESGKNGWDPDDHNQEYSTSEWLDLISNCGFELVSMRATTLFPPLHLYGIPKFWFTNEPIHKIDSLMCKIPGLRRLGQTAICIFKKTS